MSQTSRIPALLSVLTLAVVSGCGGDARVELAAADSVEALGGAFQTALGEYHAELVAADDAREAGAVDAFLARVKRDAAAPEALDAHGAQFTAALAKVRADRLTEQERYFATRENIAALREVAAGLRQVGLTGLQLQAETRAVLERALARAATPSAP